MKGKGRGLCLVLARNALDDAAEMSETHSKQLAFDPTVEARNPIYEGVASTEL